MAERTRLSLILDAYCRLHDVDQKAVCREIGMSASTFTRVKQGKLPDADGFVKLMQWFLQRERP